MINPRINTYGTKLPVCALTAGDTYLKEIREDNLTVKIGFYYKSKSRKEVKLFMKRIRALHSDFSMIFDPDHCSLIFGCSHSNTQKISR